MDLIVNFGVPLLIIVFAYFVGSLLENRHFRSIIAREKEFRDFPLLTFEALPSDWTVGSSEMVHGNIVVSLDYFKRIIAGLRGIVGGRIKTYEPLLERARREAVLRMAEEARALGYHAVVNIRLETSRLANSTRDGKGTAGVEMLAFGTALRLR
jgi:uncharacterized protein YbjQ (UPF0145 family)